MSTAFAAGVSSTEPPKNNNQHANNSAFPQYPGEDVHAHAATQFIEAAEARFAGDNLLAAANGGVPPSAKQIIDIPMDSIPALPVTHRDHSRRQEARIKAQVQNAANAQKRLQITLESWTKVFTLLKISTESTAPVLSRELKELCDLSTHGDDYVGTFDGPRAWKMVKHQLGTSCMTEADKDFYRTAERMQRATDLPDGCAASEYSRKALAFLVHIRPNLLCFLRMR